MGFNLSLFLRRTPPIALRGYFNAMGLALAVDWDAPARDFQRAAFEAIESLPPAHRDSVTVDFECVEQLCDPAGQMALQAFAAVDADLLSRVRAAESNQARAITVLLSDRTLFDRALSRAYTDHLLNGRSWSAFNVRAPAVLRTDPESVATFEREISEIFARLDGSGRRLKVDPFEWEAFGVAGGSSARCIHYCIYVEGLPETHLEFRGTQLRRLTGRTVHERAIMYDPERATLDVITAGGVTVRTEIAECYARHILGVRHGIQPIVARQFTLNHLRRRQSLDTDIADGIKTVKVFLLRLASVSGIGRVTIEIDPSEQTDIYRTSEDLFGEADPLQRSDWQVTQVKLRIVFHPEPGSPRDKNVTVDLRYPNHSNIREQIRHHQVISQKYLARWGLVVESAV
jgi:hypothetical protein